MFKKSEMLRVLALMVGIGIGLMVQAAAEDGHEAVTLGAAPEVQVEVLPVL